MMKPVKEVIAGSELDTADANLFERYGRMRERERITHILAFGVDNDVLRDAIKLALMTELSTEDAIKILRASNQRI